MNNLENKILDEAIIQFQENGLKFNLDDIAKSLHISKKTIYKYYESKEDILDNLVRVGFKQIQDNKIKILESDLLLVDKLKKVLVALPQEYEQIDFRYLKDLEGLYPKVANNLKVHLENDWEPIIELIREGITQGLINNINIDILRIMITSTFESLLSTDFLESSKMSYQEALEEMVNIIIKGVESR